MSATDLFPAHPVFGDLPGVDELWPVDDAASLDRPGLVRIDTRPVVPAATVSRGVYWRRRLAVIAGLLAMAMTLALLVGAARADAEPESPAIAGYAVVEPGQSLWEVAVDHAPAGTDTRAYLDAIQSLNGLDGGDVPAWTVVVLPAR